MRVQGKKLNKNIGCCYNKQYLDKDSRKDWDPPPTPSLPISTGGDLPLGPYPLGSEVASVGEPVGPKLEVLYDDCTSNFKNTYFVCML